MKPIELVYLAHSQADHEDDSQESLVAMARRLRHPRPRLGEGMRLQSDTPAGLLKWLETSMA